MNIENSFFKSKESPGTVKEKHLLLPLQDLNYVLDKTFSSAYAHFSESKSGVHPHLHLPTMCDSVTLTDKTLLRVPYLN